MDLGIIIIDPISDFLKDCDHRENYGAVNKGRPHVRWVGMFGKKPTECYQKARYIGRFESLDVTKKIFFEHFLLFFFL